MYISAPAEASTKPEEWMFKHVMGMGVRGPNERKRRRDYD
jgi:hypothetical protein